MTQNNELMLKMINFFLSPEASRNIGKFTPGVNFTNILRTAFALADPKGVKRYLLLTVFFYAFGINERKSST
jgi:hypothetical protein